MWEEYKEISKDGVVSETSSNWSCYHPQTERGKGDSSYQDMEDYGEGYPVEAVTFS
jgi:hypothetical protein